MPISPFVATLSFAIYLACRMVSRHRVRRGWERRSPVTVRDAVVAVKSAT